MLRPFARGLRDITVKSSANGRNIVGYQLPTLLDVTCCVRLLTLLLVVACCWELLRKAGLKRVKHLATRKRTQRARSIQPKFPEISVQNSMNRFGPTGKVSKKISPPFDVDHFSR